MTPVAAAGQPRPAGAAQELVSIGLGGLWIGPEDRPASPAPAPANDGRRAVGPAGHSGPAAPVALPDLKTPSAAKTPPAEKAPPVAKTSPAPRSSPEELQDAVPLPRVHYLFARRERADDLARFARTYGPFQLAGAAGDRDGELVFHGRGTAAASPAERRMIFEWTKAVTVEIGGEEGQAPFGLAVAWHRGASGSGVCDDLEVYLSGEVRAGSCGAGAAADGRLEGERLERLYGWIDGLAAFQQTGEQGVRADALLDRLIFAGRGQHRASTSDVAAIAAFAGSLHRELTGSPPPPAPATARVEKKKDAEETADDEQPPPQPRGGYLASNPR